MKYYTDLEMTTEAKPGDLVAVAVPEIGEPLIQRDVAHRPIMGEHGPQFTRSLDSMEMARAQAEMRRLGADGCDDGMALLGFDDPPAALKPGKE